MHKTLFRFRTTRYFLSVYREEKNQSNAIFVSCIYVKVDKSYDCLHHTRDLCCYRHLDLSLSLSLYIYIYIYISISLYLSLSLSLSLSLPHLDISFLSFVHMWYHTDIDWSLSFVVALYRFSLPRMYTRVLFCLSGQCVVWLCVRVKFIFNKHSSSSP